jgi:integrase
VEKPAQEARKLDKKGLHTMPRQPRKKAVYGGGSVYRRKSDGRYVASFIVEETGQRKYLYADKDDNTERNAYKKLQDALFEQKQGILATGPKQTVEHYLRSWVNDVYKHDVRETTYLKNLTVINSNIIPAIGHVQLRKLAPQHVQSFYTDLIKKGYRSSSVRSIHKLLHKALKNAVGWKLIPFNVCEQVTVPRDLVEQEEVAQALTPVQILSLLRAEAKMLHVSRTVTHVWGHGYIAGPPKTKNSKRDIVLPQYIVDVLGRHREKQLEIKHKAGNRWEEKDLVYCTMFGGYQQPGATLARFRRLLEQAGLPRIRIHDLRHSASTLLIRKLKMDPKLVQELLGHSNVEITLDVYTHDIDKADQRGMMDVFNDFLSEDF